MIMNLVESYTVEKYIDGAAAFAIHYYHDDTNLAILTSLKIKPKHRGKGLGTLTLKKAEQLCLTKGFSRIALQVQRNTWMHGWYKRHGYNEYEASDDCFNVWLVKEIFT